jgi:large subunit ribosomal protein L3
MIAAGIAQKLGMTHIYDNNRHVAVTILKLVPQAVSGVRTEEHDGYQAVQIGAVTKKAANKPQRDELSKSGIEVAATRRFELRTDEMPTLGEAINVSAFAPGDILAVTGVSKGKGFAGTIKRHGFHRGPESHGSKNVRKPGSIGSGYPQRVVLGRRMAGHMGQVQVTSKGHRVMAINEADNTVAVTGSIPGAPRSHVIIRKVQG